MFSKMFNNPYGKMLGGMFAGFTGPSFTPPPSFDDSALLMFCDGTNTDGTHKTDLINGYDMKAVDGPCLTLAFEQAISMAGHGSLVASLGDGRIVYDGVTLTCSSAGAVFRIEFSDGKVFPCCEGEGLQILSTDGLSIGILPVDTVWGATQDEYFFTMNEGYVSDNYNVSQTHLPTSPLERDVVLQLEVYGSSSITISGTTYTEGDYLVSGLLGLTTATALYSGGEDELIPIGGAISGSYPNYVIDLSESEKVVLVFQVNTSNLLVNGDFSAETAGYVIERPDAAVTVNGATQGVFTTTTSVSQFYGLLTENLTSGTTYRLTFDLIAADKAFYVLIGNQNSYINPIVLGEVIVELTPTSNLDILGFMLLDGGEIVVDNLVVEAI